ncbi:MULTISPECIES: hypothetical protein [unclassified Paenibacillus]|uniref:hypothetical protein n=1 Tax=unclassified Paenibacillus TaxID=185978 RepID=UPI00104BD977|nr:MULTISPECIES: hypothetical protein [unclassified Paenibacillus]NIK69088.1 hypothetical protein [Paenibacillus sp. BK720]TCM89091.1 hypothetical protein EV294_11332 [Paenibacillus sp. BK033]
MTDIVKLSQWDALLVESLRKGHGWSDDEIVAKVKAGSDLPKDDSIFQFNYSDLAAFAQKEPETFEAAVRGGYQIKYNTVRGLRSWIWVAFGDEPQLELEAGQEAVTAQLTPEQLERLRTALSFGWSIEPVAGAAGTYRIEPIQR